MEPFTPSEVSHYETAMGGYDGFSSAHSVGADIRPLAHDPLPPINSRGGRTVPSGWTAQFAGRVTQKWCNSFGSIHGACHAWVVDNLCGFTLELLATESWWGAPMAGGVTLGIEMAYYDSTEIGRDVLIAVRVDRMSGTLAYVTVDICEVGERGGGGRRLASGRQLQTWRAGNKDKARL